MSFCATGPRSTRCQNSTRSESFVFVADRHLIAVDADGAGALEATDFVHDDVAKRVAVLLPTPGRRWATCSCIAEFLMNDWSDKRFENSGHLESIPWNLFRDMCPEARTKVQHLPIGEINRVPLSRPGTQRRITRGAFTECFVDL